ncbi:MAG TPA: MBL fold metallo-hydrolase [Clostridia bacterium]|nr:MBL fold metallo-hydrolase [Clostridia bacterium]
MQIRHIRHATFILEFNGKKILIDPMLGEKGSMAPIPNVPNKEGNPTAELKTPLETILAFDAVIITHIHRDHFDEAAIELLPKDRPVFCQPEDEKTLKGIGFQKVNAIPENAEWEGISFTRTGGRHGHGTTALKLAPVSGFVLAAPGEQVIYITGDSVYCSCVVETLDRFKPGVVVCNCGEARFRYGRPITMNAQDVLAVCNKLPEARVVCVHMEAWNHCRLTRKALSNFADNSGIKSRVYIPDDGEILEPEWLRG